MNTFCWTNMNGLKAKVLICFPWNILALKFVNEYLKQIIHRYGLVRWSLLVKSGGVIGGVLSIIYNRKWCPVVFWKIWSLYKKEMRKLLFLTLLCALWCYLNWSSLKIMQSNKTFFFFLYFILFIYMVVFSMLKLFP